MNSGVEKIICIEKKTYFLLFLFSPCVVGEEISTPGKSSLGLGVEPVVNTAWRENLGDPG